MTVKEFDAFVKRQHETGEVDWDHERDEWLAHLEALYSKIESMLSGYTSSGKINIRYKTIELNEEDIGSYQARQMVLRIGRQEVDLVPAGTRFIGFKGYVEVTGSAGKARLALANKGRQSTLPEVAIGVGIITPRTRELEKVQTRSAYVPSNAKIEWVWKILPRPPGRELVEVTRESLFQLLMEVTNG